jgi:hypothetical protein
MAGDTSMFEHIKHSQYGLRGKTFSWLGEDNEENFQRHLVDPVKKQRLEESGWTTQDITYTFNQHGFRSQEFDPNVDNLCVFGCSITFGCGINQHQRYSDMLANDLGLSCYNLGINGGNDSTSFRLAYSWLPILKPKLIIFQTTFPERYEIIQNGHGLSMGVNAALGGDAPVGQGDMYKIWMVNEENSQVLAIKNLLAMKALCYDLGIKLIQIRHEEFFGLRENCARDTHHPGHAANQYIVELIKTKL